MNSPNQRGFAWAFPPLAKRTPDSPEARGLDPVAPSAAFAPLMIPSTLRIDGAGEPTRDVGRNGGVVGGVLADDDDL